MLMMIVVHFYVQSSATPNDHEEFMSNYIDVEWKNEKKNERKSNSKSI